MRNSFIRRTDNVVRITESLKLGRLNKIFVLSLIAFDIANFTYPHNLLLPFLKLD